jgi:hypothetical protein
VHQKLQIEVITNLLDEVWPSKLDPQESQLLIESVVNYLVRTTMSDMWDEDFVSSDDVYVCENLNLDVVCNDLIEKHMHKVIHLALERDDESHNPTLENRKMVAS